MDQHRGLNARLTSRKAHSCDLSSQRMPSHDKESKSTTQAEYKAHMQLQQQENLVVVVRNYVHT